jgi:DNA repair protein RecO (recombination protein O)
MSAEKTLAIVLRVVDFIETSAVVTLFTEGFGKISGLAKGARRPKGPFESALDLLAVCRIVFLHKSSDALDLLTEAKLDRRFRSASRDLSRLYAGYYVAELLNELTDEADPHPELFQAANATLAALDEGQNVAVLVLQFELTALRLLGHLPSLERCVGCGQQVPPSARVHFGLLAGGVLCRSCRTGERQVISISAAGLDLLRQLSAAQEELPREEIARPVYGELRGVINQYMSHLLGHRPRLHDFLGTQAG